MGQNPNAGPCIYLRKQKVHGKTENQQQFITNLVSGAAVNIAGGPAGTGKTYIATAFALALLEKKLISNIIITRPVVGTEDIGTLPGGMEEKMSPWMTPIFESIEKLGCGDVLDASNAATLKDRAMPLRFNNSPLQILPFQYMRGRTLDNTVIIVDEAQNVTEEQVKTILGRVGKGSILIFCGDLDQVDLPKNKKSGLAYLLKLQKVHKPQYPNTVKNVLQGKALPDTDRFTSVHFEAKDCHRSKVCQSLLFSMAALEAQEQAELDDQKQTAA